MGQMKERLAGSWWWSVAVVVVVVVVAVVVRMCVAVTVALVASM